MVWVLGRLRESLAKSSDLVIKKGKPGEFEDKKDYVTSKDNTQKDEKELE